MNAAQTSAALALRAEDVCRQLLPKGRRQGRYWVAGDLDGAPGRSLYVRLAGPGRVGKWTDAATGEHGDLLDLIQYRARASTLRGALAEARAFLALPAPPVSPSAGGGAVPRDTSVAARRLWRRCRPIDNTHAERYLRVRGLARCRFPALRFHPALRYREGDTVSRLPALVAAVTGDDGAVLGVQRTWLDPKRPVKAEVAAPRKALGRVFGRAVRFGPGSGPGLGPGAPDQTLLVGEGVETVLSLLCAAPEITAAAALSAGSFGAFAPPPGVTRLLIARDNDRAGERAANRLARRCARAGVACAVLVPDGGDFNDDLLVLGPAALAARLAPWLHGGEVRESEGGYRVGKSGKEKRRAAMMRKADTEKADKVFAAMQELREAFDILNGDLGVALVQARTVYHRMEELDGRHEDLWAELQKRDRINKYAGLERRLLDKTHERIF